MKKSCKTGGKRSGQAQSRTGGTRIFRPLAKAKISQGSKKKRDASTANVEQASLHISEALRCLWGVPRFRFVADDLAFLLRDLEAA